MKTFKVYYQDNEKIRSKLLNENELKNSNYDIVKIKEVYTLKIFFNKKKIKDIDLINLFSQLFIMLKAKILFIDAIVILINNCNNKSIKDLLYSIKNALNSGVEIHEALEEQKDIIPYEVIYFFKLGAKKINFLNIVEAIKNSLKQKHDNKNLLIKKLSYPLFVLFSFVISLVMIFIIVIPKFEYIFTEYKMQLPLATKLLLNTKDFLFSYSLIILIFICISFFIIKFLYIKNEKFCFFIDKYLLKVPFLGKLVLLYELYNFFTSLNILLKARFDFFFSFNNSILLLKNKYLLDRMLLINTQLKSGLDISTCFRNVNIFDDVVLSLIDTGVKSASLDITINEVVKIYEYNFNKSIKDFSSLIEPIFFIGIMILILWVFLSIFVPLWSIQGLINM